MANLAFGLMMIQSAVGATTLRFPDTNEANATAKVEKLYGEFLRELAATGNQNAAVFRHMLVERQMLMGDILEAGHAEGFDLGNRNSRKPVSNLLHQSVLECNKRIKAVVGADVYTAFVRWQGRRPDVNTARQLEDRLAPDEALSSAQRERLIALLNEMKDATGWKRAVSIPDENGTPIPFRVIPQTAFEPVRAQRTAGGASGIGGLEVWGTD